MSITEETSLKIMSKEEQLEIERMAGEGCVNQPADDSGQMTEEKAGEAVELLENSSNLSIICHFIEAEVPIPQSLTVEGILDAG
jgi:hypothetical protein